MVKATRQNVLASTPGAGGWWRGDWPAIGGSVPMGESHLQPIRLRAGK